MGSLAPFTLIQLAGGLLVAAVIVPLTGALLAVLRSTSGRSAVTDQDIALFLLTPAGAAGVLALVSPTVIAAVLGIVAMTGALPRNERRPVAAVLSGLRMVARRFVRLFAFATRLVLRLLLLAAPFVLAGAGVAWLALWPHDINFYMACRPPVVLFASGIGGLLATALAGVLLSRLSTWAISLHLVLSGRADPRRSFDESERFLRGRRGGVVVRIAVWALVRGVLAAGGLALGAGLMERVSAERQVEIIAHHGADWVEIDVQDTADGKVAVVHDSDSMKLAEVDPKVRDATLDDLAGIDVGSWFDPAHADRRTPTLRDVPEAAKGRGKILMELKYYGRDVALEDRVAEIVERTGMAADVGVMSLKIRGVGKMQALRPEWFHGIPAATVLGDVSALDADFAAVNTRQVSVQLIRRVHAQDKKLYVWTVDDPLTMTRMISMGVDGPITNEPARARQVMAARNRLSAPERLLLRLSDRFLPESSDAATEDVDA